MTGKVYGPSARTPDRLRRLAVFCFRPKRLDAGPMLTGESLSSQSAASDIPATSCTPQLAGSHELHTPTGWLNSLTQAAHPNCTSCTPQLHTQTHELMRAESLLVLARPLQPHDPMPPIAPNT